MNLFDSQIRLLTHWYSVIGVGAEMRGSTLGSAVHSVHSVRRFSFALPSSDELPTDAQICHIIIKLAMSITLNWRHPNIIIITTNKSRQQRMQRVPGTRRTIDKCQPYYITILHTYNSADALLAVEWVGSISYFSWRSIKCKISVPYFVYFPK